MLPQGLVRRGLGAASVPSDDALGPRLTLVGFGCDPAASLRGDLLAAWTGAGGCTVQVRHRGQPPHGGGWEAIDNALVPGAAPVGWVAVVRPDRTVMHDGALADVDRIVSDTLALLQARHRHCADLPHAGAAASIGAETNPR